MAGYSRAEILEIIIRASHNMNTLYQQEFVNYRGLTTDTKEPYSEVIAEFLVNRQDLFGNITPITRQRKYRVSGHDGSTNKESSNRIEERVALGMFGRTFNHIGKIIDYQVPLKNAREDKNVGKIDLMALKEDTLTILELKKEDSQETLLRCMLEASTYWRKVDKDKLLQDYSEFNAQKIQTAALVFKDKAQHNEYKEARANVLRLMEQLDVGLYVIGDHDRLQVFEVELP